MAKYLDENGLARVWQKIKDFVANAVGTKVDKVAGKGLSTNDYDKTAKDKVDAIPANPKYTDTTYEAGDGISIEGNVISTTGGGGGGGEENVIEAITMNDASVPVTNKTAAITETDPTVPSWAKQPNKPSYQYSEIDNTPDLSGFITKRVNDLTNYYLKSETYTKSEVQTLIDAIKQFTYESVASLPTASSDTMHKIYLVPSSDPQTSNVKDEYITIESSGSYSWEQIGSTAIDLSGYVTTSVLNTALADYTTTANLTTLLAGKQDTISDLSTIRSGASLGAMAYQKPSTGIPASDLASGVIPTVPVQDVTVGGTSVVSNGTAVIPAIPTVPTNVSSFTNDAGYLTQHQDISGKADKVLVATTEPSGGMLPNVLYQFGELSGNTTFTLATPSDNTIANHYYFTFDTPSTAPTITWPTGLTWFGGSAPTISASKHYEISVLNGIAIAMEV